MEDSYVLVFIVAIATYIHTIIEPNYKLPLQSIVLLVQSVIL